jgi:hypothetical protein
MVDTSISFMRSLCMGVIEEQVILPFPGARRAEGDAQGVIDAINQPLGGRGDDFDVGIGKASCPRSSSTSSNSSGCSAW